MDLVIQLLIGANLAVCMYWWGRCAGYRSHRERMEQEIFRLYQEGRMSPSLRILELRLNGLPDYNEPMSKP